MTPIDTAVCTFKALSAEPRKHGVCVTFPTSELAANFYFWLYSNGYKHMNRFDRIITFSPSTDYR